VRGPEDAIALLAGIEDGTIDAITSDHTPARAVDVELPFGDAAAGMSGLETTLCLVLEAVAAGRLGLVRAMRALSLGPWRALEGERLDLPEPSLRAGAEANLVVFDRDGRWTVDVASLRSRGHNTPLLDRALPGQVLFTIARGRLAWSDPDDG
jgi:dihydroorotase